MWVVLHISTGEVIFDKRGKLFYSRKEAIKFLARLRRISKFILSLYQGKCVLPSLPKSYSDTTGLNRLYFKTNTNTEFRIFSSSGLENKMRKEHVNFNNLIGFRKTVLRYWPHLNTIGELRGLFDAINNTFMIYRKDK